MVLVVLSLYFWCTGKIWKMLVFCLQSEVSKGNHVVLLNWLKFTDFSWLIIFLLTFQWNFGPEKNILTWQEMTYIYNYFQNRCKSKKMDVRKRALAYLKNSRYTTGLRQLFLSSQAAKKALTVVSGTNNLYKYLVCWEIISNTWYILLCI